MPAAPKPEGVPPAARDIIGTSGEPLDASVRSYMEPRLGHDLGDVRVHRGARAAASARSLGAQAYTVGSHVVFGEGRYAPETPAGRHLLAHELAHVIQQRRGGSVAPTPAATASLESAADIAAHAVAGGARAQVSGASAPRLARIEESGGPQPRSLSHSLDATTLSDDEIRREIALIDQYLSRQTTSDETTDHLFRSRDHLAQTLASRRAAQAQPAQAAAAPPGSGAASTATPVAAGMVIPGLPGLRPPGPTPPWITGSAIETAEAAEVATGAAETAEVATGTAEVVSGGAAEATGVVETVETGGALLGGAALAGIAAFIGVMLWPNETVSGDEERRMMEESRRQQASQQPQPAPQAPAQPTVQPVPQSVPLPNIGEAAHERRHADQTCTNEVLNRLQREMHGVCDRIPGESCSPSKVSEKRLARRPCSQIRLRIHAIEECLRRRQDIQNECFGGRPDQTHQDVLDQLNSGLAACRALEATNCAPGHPMANL